MKIQAMILSGLHFGDNNSILHYEHPDRKIIFKELVKEIKDRRQDQDAESRDKQIPYLILNGDVYDLSFAEYKYAFGDAKHFFKMAGVKILDLYAVCGWTRILKIPEKILESHEWDENFFKQTLEMVLKLSNEPSVKGMSRHLVLYGKKL